jgi:NAD(P)-dependent dehydrogenase (short-subunit alcohol dehydrogenase family)
VDVRDYDGLKALMQAGRHELGRLDIVVATDANASYQGPSDIDEAGWNEMIDTDVKGVWHTINAAVPFLLEQETGSIIVCASAAGVLGVPGLAHHVAAREGAIGLMRAFASELAGSGIRVNAVCPIQIDSPMTFDDDELRSFGSGLDAPTSDATALSTNMNVTSVCWAEPRDVSNAVLFLASDEARYITGTALPVDAGILVRTIAR